MRVTGGETSQSASVEFVPRNYAHGRLQTLVGKARKFFDRLKIPGQMPWDFFSLSKNPCFYWAKAGDFLENGTRNANMERKMEFFPLHIASFFRFMAAYFSLTHLVTAAKPLWWV